jgi:ribosomal protein L2
MTEFRVGDRVQMASCDGAIGVVVGFSRGKVQVRFDTDSATWILRPKSLQIVGEVEAQAPQCGHRTSRGSQR